MKSAIRSWARLALHSTLLAALAACGGHRGGSGSDEQHGKVGGTVTGLAGSGLWLQLVTQGYGGRPVGVSAPLRIRADGTFTFPERFPQGTSARVRINEQPSSPAQRCVVHNKDIDVGVSDVTDVLVMCSEFAFVTHASDNTVSAYRIDATTGALTRAAAPALTGAGPSGLVATPDKRFVFVGNEASNDISVFAFNNDTGELAQVPGSPFAAGSDPQALALDVDRDPYGYFYVANAGSDDLSAYAVDANTGALTPLTPATYATGRGPSSIVLWNHFVFVANSGSNDISVFSIDIDGDTGNLTPVDGSPFAAGASPLSLAIGAYGTFLYSASADGTNSSLSGFSIDILTGALTPLSGSPFTVAVSHHIVTDRDGAHLYATVGTGIAGYSIDPTTGSLTALPGFPLATGGDAYSITVDAANAFLYVANDDDASISAFSLDASSGGLTPVADSPFDAGNFPAFIATF